MARMTPGKLRQELDSGNKRAPARRPKKQTAEPTTGVGGLSPAEREALEVLAKECSEVIKACMKLLRHGKAPTDRSVDPPVSYDNVADLAGEIKDALAGVHICKHVGIVDVDGIINDRGLRESLRRLIPYLHHIDTTGLLD